MKTYLYIILCALLLLAGGYFILSMLLSNDEEGNVVNNSVSEEVQHLSTPTLPAPRSGDSESPHFMGYELDAKTYYQFVEAPSPETLAQLKRGVTAFSLSETTPRAVRREDVLSEPLWYDEGITHIRLGMHFVVDESFLRFVGDTAELQAFLAEQGVTYEIEYVAVLETAANPVMTWEQNEEGNYFTSSMDSSIVIWIRADGKSFFINLKVQFDGPGDNMGTLVYQFYTHADFYELIRPREGTLIVNGVDITEGNHVEFHRDHAALSLLPVLRALGADVRWLDNEAASIVFNEIEYVLNVTEMSLFRDGYDAFYDNILVPPIGASGRFEILEGEPIVDAQYTMWQIARALGVEMHVDSEQLVVTIG